MRQERHVLLTNHVLVKPQTTDGKSFWRKQIPYCTDVRGKIKRDRDKMFDPQNLKENANSCSPLVLKYHFGYPHVKFLIFGLYLVYSFDQKYLVYSLKDFGDFNFVPEHE